MSTVPVPSRPEEDLRPLILFLHLAYARCAVNAEDDSNQGRSGHPARCQGCRGTGWAAGPQQFQTIGGRRIAYDTLIACRHDWWHDDNGWDPYTDQPHDRDHPRARRAYESGRIQGARELAAMRGEDPPEVPAADNELPLDYPA
jgi:hypothetical protein